jgi:hypothetical protein
MVAAVQRQRYTWIMMGFFGFLPCAFYFSKDIALPPRGVDYFFSILPPILPMIRDSLGEQSALACEQAAHAVQYFARKKDGADCRSAIQGTESKEEP